MIEFTLLEFFGWRGTRDNEVKILRAKFQQKIVERLNDAYNALTFEQVDQFL
jgi:hypothetical protein